MASFKSPPVWGADVPFDFWLNDVKVWQAVTDLTVQKQGPAVALSLQGRRRDVALEIPIAQLGADDSLDQLLVKLKNVFGKETVDQQYEAYELFESMRRSSDGVVPDYIPTVSNIMVWSSQIAFWHVNCSMERVLSYPNVGWSWLVPTSWNIRSETYIWCTLERKF